MTNSITTETIKVLLHLQRSTFLLLLICFLLLILCLIILGIFSRNIDFVDGVSLIWVSVIPTTVLGMFVFNSFVPLEVTKTTQVQKESPQILQVDGKLLSSEGLTLFLKDSQGNYSKKKISVDGDVKIKEEGNSYAYTQIKTKVTYNTKHKVRAIFSEIPRDKTTVKATLTIPKGVLK